MFDDGEMVLGFVLAAAVVAGFFGLKYALGILSGAQ
jgi:hypothetical protein